MCFLKPKFHDLHIPRACLTLVLIVKDPALVSLSPKGQVKKGSRYIKMISRDDLMAQVGEIVAVLNPQLSCRSGAENPEQSEEIMDQRCEVSKIF